MTDLAASLFDLSVTDVLAVTGVEVELVDLTRAAEVIEIYTNRTEAATAGMFKRDIRWIKKAICWQAAWLMEQPDYHARQNADRLSQDGQQLGLSPAASVEGREYAVTLAPMAARSLKNLSWKAMRSIRTPRDPAVNANFAPSGFLVADSPWDTTGWEHL